jgi:histidine triad (HIT) family protein
MKFICTLITGLLLSAFSFSQKRSVEEYRKFRDSSLKEKSPFEKIVDREAPATIIYEDKYVIAFLPLGKSSIIHYLIVPKKRISTVNDVTEKDAKALGHLFLAAKAIAKKFGIEETGYRLIVNTNRDAGQSVFHLHMHIVGGKYLGPAVDPELEK